MVDLWAQQLCYKGGVVRSELWTATDLPALGHNAVVAGRRCGEAGVVPGDTVFLAKRSLCKSRRTMQRESRRGEVLICRAGMDGRSLLDGLRTLAHDRMPTYPITGLCPPTPPHP